MIRSFRKSWVALAAAAMLAFGACSEGDGPDASENPKDALTSALDTLQEWEGATVTLTLASDTASLVALSEGELPEEVAEQILNSSLRFSGSGEDPETSDAEIVVNVDGSDAIEFKVVDGDALYLRADVRGLVERFGGDMAEIDTALGALEGQGLDFIGPAVDGEWIGMTGLKELTEQFGGAVPSQPDEEQMQAIDAFVAALEEAADVTSEGSDDAGDHLVVSIPLREAYEALVDAAGQLGGLGAGAPLPPSTEVPEGNLDLDVWISDDAVSQIEFDITQLARFEETEMPEGIEQFALRLTLEEFGDEVEAPDDAVMIDPQELIQGFMGGALGGMSEGASGGAAGGGTADIPELGINCTDLQGLRPADIRSFLKGAGMDNLYPQIQEACPELF